MQVAACTGYLDSFCSLFWFIESAGKLFKKNNFKSSNYSFNGSSKIAFVPSID